VGVHHARRGPDAEVGARPLFDLADAPFLVLLIHEDRADDRTRGDEQRDPEREKKLPEQPATGGETACNVRRQFRLHSTTSW